MFFLFWLLCVCNIDLHLHRNGEIELILYFCAMNKKVLVGISGGIDSFVSAVLLQEQGFEVVGVCFEFWEENDLTEVQAFCEELGIAILQRKEQVVFKQHVVDAFVDDYLNARTPSPCCVCNGYVKWLLLNQLAEELNIPYIATGHYVKIVKHNEHYYIRQGKDPVKDQSYFLWEISQEILAKSLTPLGDFTKQEVRTIAQSKGFHTMLTRKESMGVCFLKNTDYRTFISEYSGIENTPGAIYSTNGTLIGEHQGLLNYTIGQKRNIPLVAGKPMYVASMNAETNSLTVDAKENVQTQKIVLDKLNIVNVEDLSANDIWVKVRGLGLNPAGFAKVQLLENNRLSIYLSEPAWAIAAGQPVVLYQANRVIGGGYVV